MRDSHYFKIAVYETVVINIPFMDQWIFLLFSSLLLSPFRG